MFMKTFMVTTCPELHLLRMANKQLSTNYKNSMIFNIIAADNVTMPFEGRVITQYIFEFVCVVC